MKNVARMHAKVAIARTKFCGCGILYARDGDQAGITVWMRERMQTGREGG